MDGGGNAIPVGRKLGGKAETAMNQEAAWIAGSYLRNAAISWARENLAPIHWNEDNRIAQVEVMLRAARHMHRTDILDGDPIPSIRLADGSVIPMTTRLLQLMDRDQVLQAKNADDYKSSSKASKATKEGRDARARIEEVAARVVRE